MSRKVKISYTHNLAAYQTRKIHFKRWSFLWHCASRAVQVRWFAVDELTRKWKEDIPQILINQKKIENTSKTIMGSSLIAVATTSVLIAAVSLSFPRKFDLLFIDKNLVCRKNLCIIDNWSSARCTPPFHLSVVNYVKTLRMSNTIRWFDSTTAAVRLSNYQLCASSTGRNPVYYYERFFFRV